MKFVQTNNKRSEFIIQRDSAGGLIQVGIYPVLFGYRVRAGFTEDRVFVALDWCAGGELSDAIRLFDALLELLSWRIEDEDCFDGLPVCSLIKPVWNDPEFMAWLRGQFNCAVAKSDGQINNTPNPTGVGRDGSRTSDVGQA